MFQDALSRARQKNAERQRAYRERKRQEREAQRRPDTPPADNVPRNVTKDVTGTITGNGNNGPTSSSTNTITIPLSESVVVGNPVHSDSDGGTGISLTPASEWEAENWNVLQVMGGELGQGVLTLTVWQDRVLLELLGLDGYEYYCKRLVAWVKKSGATVNHYQTILKWWREDTQRVVPPVPMGDHDDGPDIIWGGGT